MTWTKLSDDFYDKESINELSHEAFRLHVYALVWCNKQLTDGRISVSRLRRLLPEADIGQAQKELVTAGMWAVLDDGQIQIDWSGQEKSEAVRKRQEGNARAQALWRERQERHAAGDHSVCTKTCPHRDKTGSKPLTEPMTTERTHAVTKDAPTRPFPTQGEGKGKQDAAAGRAGVVPLRIAECGHVLVDDRHCDRGCSPEAVSA